MVKQILIGYKAYLIKPGYDEENVDKKLINFAMRSKRKDILENKIKKRRKSPIKSTALSQILSQLSPTLKPDSKNLSTSLKMMRN